MISNRVIGFVIASLLVACGTATPPEAKAPPPALAPPVEPVAVR